jgi:3-methyladenine DNA glycosylase AlkD
METLSSIMLELEVMGSEQTRKIHRKHGAPDNLFGVKVGDMKKIVKRIKKNHKLSLALFDTGNSDAMYLAGLIGDEKKITESQLQHWAENSSWHMISEYTVPFVAAESPYAWPLSLAWVQSPHEKIASTGWCTLSRYVAMVPDGALDIGALKSLVTQIEKTIHTSDNRVRYTMNGFLIALGGYVLPLTDFVKKAAVSIGELKVNMDGTACQVPNVIAYIEKMEKAGVLGKKRKTARC